MAEHDTTRIAVNNLIAAHNYQEFRLMQLTKAYKSMEAAFERYKEKVEKGLSTKGAE